jgi:membrane protease YdiL (CAAX protease family)
MWVAFSVLSPLLMFALTLPIVRLIKGAWPNLRLLGQANYLPDLGIGVALLWLATFGFGEETGWRGFVLPRLQKTMSASKATLFLALMWVVWHTPAFLYLDTLRHAGWVILPGFIVGVLFGAVIFTWIYNGSGGSVFYVAVWHGLFDMLTASKVAQEIIPIVMTAMVIVIVLVITRVNRPWNFHRLGKITL